MSVQIPELSSDRIAKWIEKAAREHQRNQSAEPAAVLEHVPPFIGFDFRKAKQSIERARAKTTLSDTLKPLRRIRRNQGAVNDSLVAALGALMTVNKQMAREIERLHLELGQVRPRVAEQERAASARQRDLKQIVPASGGLV